MEKDYGLAQFGWCEDNRLSITVYGAPEGRGFATQKSWRFPEAMYAGRIGKQ
jgi:hypothetical protein